MAVKLVLQGSLGLSPGENQSCKSGPWLVQLYLNHSMLESHQRLCSLMTEETA